MRRLLPALVLMMSSVAYAGYTGNDLWGDLGKRDGCGEIAAATFIRGYTEAQLNLRPLWDKLKIPGPVCLPAEVTGQQAVDVVKQYLERNPAERHMSAGNLVLAALITAWPCQRGH